QVYGCVGCGLIGQVAQERGAVEEEVALAARILVVDPRDRESDLVRADRNSDTVASAQMMAICKGLAYDRAVRARQTAKDRVAVLSGQEAQPPVAAHDFHIAGAQSCALTTIVKRHAVKDIDRCDTGSRGKQRDDLARERWEVAGACRYCGPDV